METERGSHHTFVVGRTARIYFTGIDCLKSRRLAHAGTIREAAAAGGWDGCILAYLLVGVGVQFLGSHCATAGSILLKTRRGKTTHGT